MKDYRCPICGSENYRVGNASVSLTFPDGSNKYPHDQFAPYVSVAYLCKQCGHVDLFVPDAILKQA